MLVSGDESTRQRVGRLRKRGAPTEFARLFTEDRAEQNRAVAFLRKELGQYVDLTV